MIYLIFFNDIRDFSRRLILDIGFGCLVSVVKVSGIKCYIIFNMRKEEDIVFNRLYVFVILGLGR